MFARPGFFRWRSGAGGCVKALKAHGEYGKAFNEVLARVQQSLQDSKARELPIRMYIRGRRRASSMDRRARYGGHRRGLLETDSLSEDIEVSYRDPDGRARLLYRIATTTTPWVCFTRMPMTIQGRSMYQGSTRMSWKQGCCLPWISARTRTRPLRRPGPGRHPAARAKGPHRLGRSPQAGRGSARRICRKYRVGAGVHRYRVPGHRCGTASTRRRRETRYRAASTTLTPVIALSGR